jgi:DNA-binding CsgD family transcriptional regulator
MAKTKSPVLTKKEIQILKLVCKQLTNKEIAVKLGYSPRTIEDRRRSILIKTRSKNSLGILIYAMKNGLVKI